MQKISLGLILLIFLSACGMGSEHGTETGNADTPVTNTPSVPSPASSDFADVLCSDLQTCNTAVNASCETLLNGLTGLPQVLGVSPATGLTTLAEVSAAVGQGTISQSSNAESTCLADFAILPCATMASGYDAGTNSYAGMIALIGQIQACGQVYGP